MPREVQNSAKDGTESGELCRKAAEVPFAAIDNSITAHSEEWRAQTDIESREHRMGSACTDEGARI